MLCPQPDRRLICNMAERLCGHDPLTLPVWSQSWSKTSQLLHSRKNRARPKPWPLTPSIGQAVNLPPELLVWEPGVSRCVKLCRSRDDCHRMVWSLLEEIAGNNGSDFRSVRFSSGHIAAISDDKFSLLAKQRCKVRVPHMFEFCAKMIPGVRCVQNWNNCGAKSGSPISSSF